MNFSDSRFFLNFIPRMEQDNFNIDGTVGVHNQCTGGSLAAYNGFYGFYKKQYNISMDHIFFLSNKKNPFLF